MSDGVSHSDNSDEIMLPPDKKYILLKEKDKDNVIWQLTYTQLPVH